MNRLNIINYWAVTPVNQTSFCEDGPRFSNENPCLKSYCWILNHIVVTLRGRDMWYTCYIYKRMCVKSKSNCGSFHKNMLEQKLFTVSQAVMWYQMELCIFNASIVFQELWRNQNPSAKKGSRSKIGKDWYHDSECAGTPFIAFFWRHKSTGRRLYSNYSSCLSAVCETEKMHDFSSYWLSFVEIFEASWFPTIWQQVWNNSFAQVSAFFKKWFFHI